MIHLTQVEMIDRVAAHTSEYKKLLYSIQDYDSAQKNIISREFFLGLFLGTAEQYTQYEILLQDLQHEIRIKCDTHMI